MQTDRPFTGYCPEHGPVVAVHGPFLGGNACYCPICHRRCTGPGADAALAALGVLSDAREALELMAGVPAGSGITAARGALAARLAEPTAREALEWMRLPTSGLFGNGASILGRWLAAEKARRA